MKPIHLLFGAAIVVCTFAFAGARSSYGSVIAQQYRLERDSISIKAGCKYCHTTAFGGEGWNKFGGALKAKLDGAAKGKIQDALLLVLQF